jgi:hypothetical protein
MKHLARFYGRTGAMNRLHSAEVSGEERRHDGFDFYSRHTGILRDFNRVRICM